MTPSDPHALPAAPRSARALLLLIVCALFVAIPAAAFAHDELIGSTPADGEILASAPERIDLRFSADPLEGDGATEVLVIDPSGREVQDGDPALDRNGVIQELTDVAERGTYRVLWRIVSSDGHPISGELTYSVGETSEPAPTAAPVADGNLGGSDPAALWIIAAVVVVALGGASAAILVTRRRRGDQRS